MSWNETPVWRLRPDFYYCQTVAGLIVWGALSDERTGLSFTIAAGARQRNHSRVGVPRDSWPYFTVSDLRLPSSSSPTTRRVTVEVFDPASTRDWRINQVKVTLRLTISQSVSSGVEPHLRPMARYFLLFDSYGLVILGRPLWREDGSVLCIRYWLSPA
jgi:hypothetical protein